MKKISKWKAFFVAACVLTAVFSGGCSMIKVEEEEAKAIDYSVVREEEIPPEVRTLIDEKKKKEFQMTYKSGDNLYLVKGYGQQLSGGYSIQVEELSATESAIFFRTILIGPSQNEQQSREPSYPYIVVKTAFREEPVQFK